MSGSSRAHSAVAIGIINLAKDWVATIATGVAVSILSIAADTSINGSPVLGPTGYSDATTYFTGSSQSQQTIGQADNNLNKELGDIEAIQLGIFIGLVAAQAVFKALTAGGNLAAEEAIKGFTSRLTVNELPKLAVSAVSTAVALDLIYSYTSGNGANEQRDFKNIGFGATLLGLVIAMLNAVKGLRSFSNLFLTQQLGVAVALTCSLTGAIAAAILGGLEVVQSNYGLNLSMAILFFSIWALIWGAVGLSFSISIAAQIISFAEDSTPLPIVTTVISVIDFGTGAAAAITSGA